MYPYQNNTYNSRQQQSYQQDNRTLPSTRQPLQLTGSAVSASASRNQSSNQKQVADRNAGRNDWRNQKPRPRFGSKAYAIDENEDVVQENAQDPPEDCSGKEPKERRNYYTDEDLDYYEPRDNDPEDYFGAAAVSDGNAIISSESATIVEYRCCLQVFKSKNQLHQHLSNSGKGRRAYNSAYPGYPTESDAFPASEAT